MRIVSSSLIRRTLGIIACVGMLASCGLTGGDESASSGELGAGLALDGDPGELGTGGDVTPAADEIESVVMIGDSITKGSLPPLEADFSLIGMESVLIQAEVGKRMAVSATNNPSGASVASFLTGGDPAAAGDTTNAIWVVALGTNDVGQYASPDEIAGAVNEVLAEVPAEAPLVWVDTYLALTVEQAAELNAIVRERLDRRGNSVMAPWSAFAGGEGVLSGDGVHPTTAGTEVFAFVVVETVRAFLGR